jgi:CRP-like cAMP-binding protein
MGYVSTLQDAVIEEFAPILRHQSFLKGERIHEAGKVCPHLFLVETGILRVYYLDDIKDITANFAFKGGAITAPDSFIFGKPSKYTIEALEASTVYAVDRKELEDFLELHPQHEKLARKFTQAIYMELLERLESLVFKTAQERYELLSREYPELILNANLGYIASYLGITQETLSRIRAKVTL